MDTLSATALRSKSLEILYGISSDVYICCAGYSTPSSTIGPLTFGFTASIGNKRIIAQPTYGERTFTLYLKVINDC